MAPETALQHRTPVRPHSSLGYKPPAPEAAVWPGQNGSASISTAAIRPSMH
ncbi:transposase [Ochrobactrum pecoris]|uniref:Transposase n=1 Tax=Brucella pecoris TaxID=867683 RepID=A0A5C5CBI2_9HYPH|nr:transposase [Brucella pecoris]TNV08617.1 transposase [Brucella pecoris]